MISSIIIARSSKDRNEVSCESQIHEIRKEAHKRGEHVVRVLKFSKIAHDEFIKDPDFLEIYDEVKTKNRNWSKIWFYDTSRVSRSRLNAQYLKAHFKNHEVTIEFLKLPKTGNEPYDNMLEGMLETFDQFHSDLSRAGSIRGQSHNIRIGFRAGGKAPYGYQLKKHSFGINRDNSDISKSKLVPNPDTFEVVKEYLTRRACGESRRSIYEDFEKRCIKSPSGNKAWNPSSGKSIEENVLAYQGHTTFNRHNSRIGKKSYVGSKKGKDPKEWIITKNTHKRCIDDETAEKIKLQLEKNKGGRNNPGPKRYLLTDILYCGDCGSRMVGNSGFYSCLNKMRNSKACSNGNIKADFLNREILKYLKEKLIKKEFYQDFIATIKAHYENYKQHSLKDQKKHLKRLKELDSQITKLMTLFRRGKIKPDIIENQIEPLQQEKEGTVHRHR